jgi:hypothetical protein
VHVAERGSDGELPTHTNERKKQKQNKRKEGDEMQERNEMKSLAVNIPQCVKQKKE